MHGNTDTTLDASANVVSIPGNTLGNIGVDSHSKEEATRILDVGVLRRDQHDKTKDGDKAEADHEDTSSLESVGRPSTGDTAETSHDVWWDSHQLGGVVGISEGLDNGGEEEGVGIERSVDSKDNISVRVDDRSDVKLTRW